MRTAATALGTGTVTSVVGAVGWPALVLVALLVLSGLAFAAWVLSDDDRTSRLRSLTQRTGQEAPPPRS